MKTIQYSIICILFTLFGIQNVHAENPLADTVSFTVSGNCEMCKKTIEEALDVKGVSDADWNMETGIIVIVFNPHVITVDKLHMLIAEAGYDTDKVKASDKAYKELPNCCQYTRTKK